MRRSRRRGAGDRMQAWLGRYPFRCRACAQRFHVLGRENSELVLVEPHKQGDITLLQAPDGSTEIAFRKTPADPIAQIVVRADSHEHLDQILAALKKELSS